MLSNAYFLAKFRFDTAENEPAKNLQNFANFPNFANPNPNHSGIRGDQLPHARTGVSEPAVRGRVRRSGSSAAKDALQTVDLGSQFKFWAVVIVNSGTLILNFQMCSSPKFPNSLGM